jgi:GNAT superfamily N-acetyltransferase
MLCRLYYEFHQFVHHGLPDRLLSLGDPETYDYSYLMAEVPKIMEREDEALLVADRHGQVVGLAHICLRHEGPRELLQERAYGYLQSLMVQAQFRRHGIGRQLIHAAEVWVQEREATEIRLEAWLFAGGPIPFYELLGYRPLKQEMVRNLR